MTQNELATPVRTRRSQTYLHLAGEHLTEFLNHLDRDWDVSRSHLLIAQGLVSEVWEDLRVLMAQQEEQGPTDPCDPELSFTSVGD